MTALSYRTLKVKTVGPKVRAYSPGSRGASDESLNRDLHPYDQGYTHHGAVPTLCSEPFGKALACEAKANLHPLAFYTINVTSPSKGIGLPGIPGGARIVGAVSCTAYK